MINPYPFLRPLLFALNAERAHDLTLKTLASFPRCVPQCTISQPVELMGIRFTNRLGLAAGLDKNGVAIAGLARLGFGFLELGTVTPKAQPGNPKPRLFRLPSERAIINRMGFNNDGVDALCQRVKAVRETLDCVIGINLGKNKDTPNEQALSDYIYGMDTAYAHADYLTINISSPNTQGLRDLQHSEQLVALLEGLKRRQQTHFLDSGRYVPLVVKIAPDNDDSTLSAMLGAIKQSGMDGIIATNTTIDKQSVAKHPLGNEQGGLSGAPLTARSTAIVGRIRQQLPKIPLIASGGVMSGEDYRAKRKAGADLVQIYSGLIYRGPQLIRDCLNAESRK